MILGGRVYANKVVGFPLLVILVAEAIICGMAISKIPPSPAAGSTTGSQPQCGVLIGPFGWLVTFWVSGFSSPYELSKLISLHSSDNAFAL
ncbi:hypothetical protein CVT25_003096 [Psilocybe cyanescens]|uniref:Uncharacterized protein n=1 Tax=Psilocybe cyanescens TaxID=93625 RepID=A0A409X5W2_PSICY|nr:hypothetical protein CVT25_003096 [Psilocybe cyanescens]